VNDTPPTLKDILAGDYVFKRDIGGGRYTLKREIGRGGAATVYLARDERHERLRRDQGPARRAVARDRRPAVPREIKLTASLQHPHILRSRLGESDDQLYYVMPYVEGDSLRQRLTADSRLSIEERCGSDARWRARSAYAHERGVVHRDIKPENILFSGGHAVVADFGIARAIDRASEKITQQGTITGTPAYMSPEQARDRAFDGRATSTRWPACCTRRWRGLRPSRRHAACSSSRAPEQDAAAAAASTGTTSPRRSRR
jgi:serine/threonine-protein kinase